jgi:hypothetical protein
MKLPISFLFSFCFVLILNAQVPCINYLYQNSFETANDYWNTGGTNGTWVWGIVAKPTINKASEGTKVWVTSLKGTYANSESSYLESPCFDFTSAEYPVFAFDYWVNSENGIDGFRLDYSVDGGTTWNPVVANSNHNQNWCTGTAVSALSTDGWTGSTSTGYKLARTLLPSDVAGKNNVKFRFVFASDANSTMEGVAIDNIRIFELPYDVGVLSLANPVSGCYIGGGINPVNLTASIKNFGYRSLKIGLKVPLEIELRNESIVKDTLVISSIVNKNGTASFTSTNTYKIIAKGSHLLRLNTNFAQELDRSNDTLKTTLNVLGIPGYTLGPDIAVPNPFPASISVDLDAGLNGLVPYNNYLWSTTQTTSKITVISYGTYSVTVTNENGCTATDAINVIESTNDIEIISAAGLDNACTYPTPVHPQITIKNNGPSGVGPSFSMKNIPLSIVVDGVVMFSETFTPGTDIASGNSSVYTFTNSINISTPKTYDIRIYSKINEDYNKNNDTLKISTQVWGPPKIKFPQDTIVSLNATSIVLDAGAGFQSYTWKNSSVTTQTFTVPSLNSAWYVATVTAFNSCGTNTDSVFINAKDLSVLDIESPFDTIFNNSTQKVVVRIKNVGNDNFASGSIIKISYFTPVESASQNFTLDDTLEPNSTKLLTFNNNIKFPLGYGFISVIVNIADDPNPSNDIFEKSVLTKEIPVITTQPVSDIGLIAATGNGNITTLGYPIPTAYGVCWNKTGTPTTTDSIVNIGVPSATGAFTSALTNLTPNTTYHVRAYATNADGTVYGEEVSFVTLSSIPVDLAVADSTITTGEACFDATNEITVSTVSIEASTSANFIAGYSVTFLPGFHAVEGSYVHAWITEDGSFCDAAGGSPIVEKPALKGAQNQPAPQNRDFVSEEKSIKVYPNPNNGQFTLEFTNIESGATVSIYNMLGDRVYLSKTTNDISHKISLPEIKKGIYFVKIMDGKEQFTRKMVVD